MRTTAAQDWCNTQVGCRVPRQASIGGGLAGWKAGGKQAKCRLFHCDCCFLVPSEDLGAAGLPAAHACHARHQGSGPGSGTLPPALHLQRQQVQPV